MQKRLLIIGSLDEFVELVKEAKSRGIYTVVCDGYHNSPAKQIADKSYDINIRNVDEIVKMCREEKINGIMGSFSDLIFEQICQIADKACLKWYVKPEMLPYYREKTTAKALFHKLGINTSKNIELKSDFTDDMLNGFKFPLVIKPVNGYGSKGIYVVHSIQEIREKFSSVESRSSGNVCNIIAEEYTNGREYNMMTWLVDGRVIPISIADREKNPQYGDKLPLLNRIVYPAKAISDIMEEAVSTLQKFADFTGQKSGPLSMQFFYNESGVSVCEIAGRMFGYEHELVTYSTGLNIEKLLIDYVYDEESAKQTMRAHSPSSKRQYEGIYFVGYDGMKIADQTSAKRLADSKHIVESKFYYKDGEIIDNFGPNPYLARLYVSADTREQLDDITRDLFHRFSIKDDCGKNVVVPFVITNQGEKQ